MAVHDVMASAAALDLEIPQGTMLNGSIRIEAPIGRGSFGHVFLATKTTAMGTPSTVVKVIPLPAIMPAVEVPGVDFGDLVRAELGMMRELHHDNIVRFSQDFEASFRDRRSRAMVRCWCLEMEHLAGGSLETRVDEARVTVDEAKRWIADIARGLDYLRSRARVHRDVKLSNICLTADGTAKLVDLGASYENMRTRSARRSGSTPAQLGTPWYFSPKRLNNLVTGADDDVWALGLVAVSLLTGRAPESLCNVPPAADRDFVAQLIAQVRTAHPALESLVSRMLAWEPEDRIKASEVVLLLGEDEDSVERRRVREHVAELTAEVLELRRALSDPSVDGSPTPRVNEPLRDAVSPGSASPGFAGPLRSAVSTSSVPAAGPSSAAGITSSLRLGPGAEVDEEDPMPSSVEPARIIPSTPLTTASYAAASAAAHAWEPRSGVAPSSSTFGTFSGVTTSAIPVVPLGAQGDEEDSDPGAVSSAIGSAPVLDRDHRSGVIHHPHHLRAPPLGTSVAPPAASTVPSFAAHNSFFASPHITAPPMPGAPYGAAFASGAVSAVAPPPVYTAFPSGSSSPATSWPASTAPPPFVPPSYGTSSSASMTVASSSTVAVPTSSGTAPWELPRLVLENARNGDASSLLEIARRVQSADVAVAREAVGGVRSLVDTASPEAIFGAAGETGRASAELIAALVGRLGRLSSDQGEDVLQSVRLLGVVAQAGPASVERLVAAGAIPTLVDVLRGWKERCGVHPAARTANDIVQRALISLRRVASSSIALRDRVGGADVGSVTATLLRCESQSEDTVHEALKLCDALWQGTPAPPFAAVTSLLGGLQRVLAWAMEHPIGHAQAAEWSLAALGALSSLTGSTRTYFGTLVDWNLGSMIGAFLQHRDARVAGTAFAVLLALSEGSEDILRPLAADAEVVNPVRLVLDASDLRHRMLAARVLENFTADHRDVISTLFESNPSASALIEVVQRLADSTPSATSAGSDGIRVSASSSSSSAATHVPKVIREHGLAILTNVARFGSTEAKARVVLRPSAVRALVHGLGEFEDDPVMVLRTLAAVVGVLEGGEDLCRLGRATENVAIARVLEHGLDDRLTRVAARHAETAGESIAQIRSILDAHRVRSHPRGPAPTPPSSSSSTSSSTSSSSTSSTARPGVPSRSSGPSTHTAVGGGSGGGVGGGRGVGGSGSTSSASTASSSSSASSSEPKCPECEHLLTPAIALHHTCDVCRESIRPGLPMLSCRPCNFDMCFDCLRRRGSSSGAPSSGPSISSSRASSSSSSSSSSPSESAVLEARARAEVSSTSRLSDGSAVLRSSHFHCAKCAGIFRKEKGTGTICNECVGPIAPMDERLRCDRCNYDRCATCFRRRMDSEVSADAPIDPAAQDCPRCGTVRLAPVVQSGRPSKCGNCGNVIGHMEEHFTCRRCPFDRCLNCARRATARRRAPVDFSDLFLAMMR